MLVHRPEDLALSRFFSGGVPRRAAVRAVVTALDEVGPDDTDAVVALVRERHGIGARTVVRILNLLARVPADAGGRVDAVRRLAERGRALERSRVDLMGEYAETARCRLVFLVGYFGDPDRDGCGRCDRCRAGTAVAPADDATWAHGVSVTHAEFGDGQVCDVEADRVTVLFEAVGYRTLDREVVEGRGLLILADGAA